MTKVPLRVLHVEDHPADAEFVERLLARSELHSFEVARCSMLNSALTHLRNDHVDVVISDLGLPDAYGLDAVVSLQKVAPRTPIIVMSGTNDLQLARDAIATGASDYIEKSIDLSAQDLEKAIAFAHARAMRLESDAMFQRSIFRELQQGPPVNAPIVSGRVAKLEEAIARVRIYLQRNARAHVDMIEAIFAKCGVDEAIREIRFQLSLEDEGSKITAPISERALQAVRTTSSEPPESYEEAKRMLSAVLGD